ncbi:MAG: uracil phosphoribosyltransferase [Anaerolineae bacterium]|nr:uracil phosphoribosyltransferase [Anaerolineae bacterium]MCO5197474.1 uracil phosphoribosyltransferase [Anaerolineae bacterium]MCO5205694.1 uracil phosphoribosyltransferase [Anaerolineae bacterium]
MVFESKHPLVKHKLALLRDMNTEPKQFRELVNELAVLIGYEAAADLPTREVDVHTPMGTAVEAQLDAKIGLIPILRAGLGMVDPIWDLIPNAEVWHIGMWRDEETLEPVWYYNKLEGTPRIGTAFILDPMLATGGSALATIDVVKQWGVARIKFLALIAAPEGIAAVHAAHPDVAIYTAAIDSHLNDIGYIVPGLGDAGDRQFGTITSSS